MNRAELRQTKEICPESVKTVHISHNHTYFKNHFGFIDLPLCLYFSWPFSLILCMYFSFANTAAFIHLIILTVLGDGYEALHLALLYIPHYLISPNFK